MSKVDYVYAYTLASKEKQVRIMNKREDLYKKFKRSRDANRCWHGIWREKVPGWCRKVQVVSQPRPQQTLLNNTLSTNKSSCMANDVRYLY